MIRTLANLAAAALGAALSAIGERLENAYADLDEGEPDDLLERADAMGIVVAPGAQPPSEFDGVEPVHPNLREELDDDSLESLVSQWGTR